MSTVPVVIRDQVHRMTLLTEMLADRATAFIERIFHREPTLLVEIGTAVTTGIWAICLAVPGPLVLTPTVDDNMHRIPEEFQALAAGLVALNQALAIYSGLSRWRAWASFGAAVWLGWLSGVILAADAHLPSGYVYLGMASVSLLPFWRIYIDDEGTIN